MKIQGTIVDKDFKLIGLVMKGKPSEMGMSGNKDWITGPCSLADAKEYVKDGLVNNFSLDSDENIVGLRNNKLADYPMYDKKGNIVNKQVDIRKIFEDENGVLLGILLFIVGLNKEVKLKTKDAKFLLTYCEPSNFGLRIRDGLPYIAGKNGTKLEDIPVERKEKVKKTSNLVNANNLKVVDCILCENMYYSDIEKLVPIYSIRFCMDDGVKEFRNKLCSSFPVFIDENVSKEELKEYLSLAKTDYVRKGILEILDNMHKWDVKFHCDPELYIGNNSACILFNIASNSIISCIYAKGVENLNKTLKKIASMGYMLNYSIDTPYECDDNYLEICTLENWILTYAHLGCSFDKIKKSIDLYTFLDIDIDINNIYTLDDCIAKLEQKKHDCNSALIYHKPTKEYPNIYFTLKN